MQLSILPASTKIKLTQDWDLLSPQLAIGVVLTAGTILILKKIVNRNGAREFGVTFRIPTKCCKDQPELEGTVFTVDFDELEDLHFTLDLKAPKPKDSLSEVIKTMKKEINI